MEDRKSLSMKKDMYSIGTQHNKLTTLVLVLLGELEKVKKEVRSLKNALSTLECINTETEADNDTTSKNIKTNKMNVDEKTDQILQQLNLSQLTKSI